MSGMEQEGHLMPVKRRRLAVDQAVGAGSSERHSSEKRKNRLVEDALKLESGTQASPISCASYTPLPNFQAASARYASLSTAAKTSSGYSRGAGTSDVVLINGDPRRVDSCVSWLTNCVSTTEDPRMRAPVRSTTPGGKICHPNQDQTPRSNISCYGGLCTPATALFQLSGSPALGALTPPHLPAASGHLPDGGVKLTNQLISEGQATFNTVCRSSPAKRECVDFQNADERRIVPPHLPSRTSEPAMDAPCQVFMSSVSACLPVSPAVQEHLAPALCLGARQRCHAAPRPSPSRNMEKVHVPCARPDTVQQRGIVTVMPEQPTVIQASQCDDSQKTCLLTVPTAPAPSPALQPQPSLPHAQSDPKVPGDRRNHTAKFQRNLLSLAAPDMDRLCARLGHLSTRRAPSAPPPDSSHVPDMVVEHTAAIRALSCSPPRLNSGSHRSQQEPDTQFAAGHPHTHSAGLNTQTQLRSGTLIQHVTAGHSEAFGSMHESQLHQLHARQPLLPLCQLHHCRLAMRKGNIAHGSSRDSHSRAATVHPHEQELPEDDCGGYCLDDADPLAIYNPEDLVFFPREVAGEVNCGTATFPGTTGSAACRPANCTAWQQSIQLTQSSMEDVMSPQHDPATSPPQRRVVPLVMPPAGMMREE